MTKREELQQEERLIRKAVEDAGLEYGTFDSDFMAPEWEGKWYKYGGWSKVGNDWIVCGNSLKEIQEQISQLALDDLLLNG